jgi:DNA-binding beta-propeller fold protein YncE
MAKAVSGGVPILRTDTFLTWEPAAYSWVRFANVSPGEHRVKWEWYEPGGNLYVESEEFVLEGNGHPTYTVWGFIEIANTQFSSGADYSSVAEPSLNQPEDRTGDWQVRVYFDGGVVLTEDFKIVKAPWAPTLFGNVADGEHEIAVDSVRGLVYVSNDLREPIPWFDRERTYRVSVLDAETGELLRKLLIDPDWGGEGVEAQPNCGGPYLPSDIVVNESNGGVYVSACDVYGGSLEAEKFSFLPAGPGNTGHIAVNPVNGYVYAKNSILAGEKTVKVIGPGTPYGGMVAHLDLSFPTDTGAMAVNPTTNRVYIIGPAVVYVLDGATNEIIATIDVAGGINTSYASIAVNPETNRVYYTAVGRTTVIDGETDFVVATFDAPGRGLKVNPTTNRIFIMARDAPIGKITIVDGDTNMLIDTVFLPSGQQWGGSGLAVNPVNNRVYIANGFGWDYDDSTDPLYVMSDEPGPGGVILSKVELNPVDQSGIEYQWVELYNTGASEVDISNWTLIPTGVDIEYGSVGLTAHIPQGSILPPGGRYVVENPVASRFSSSQNWLDWTGEGLALRDAQGRLVDWTPDLTDDGSGGTPEFWQRLPAGQSSHAPSAWEFK